MGICWCAAEWLTGLPAGSKAVRCKVLNTQREPLFQREISRGGRSLVSPRTSLSRLLLEWRLALPRN
jgi:hypothetical protein